MEIKNVETLPVLDQASFPALPKIPKDKHLIVFNSSWQSAEKEFAAACIVNACIIAGKWQPVHGQQFVEQMEANPLIAPFIVQGVVNALWSFVLNDHIEAVTYKEENYFIPTTKLANTVLGNYPEHLRIA